MKRFKETFSILLIIFIIQLFAGLTAGFIGVRWYYHNRVCPGVVINGISLGGTKYEEALAILKEKVITPSTIRFHSRDQDKEFMLALKELKHVFLYENALENVTCCWQNGGADFWNLIKIFPAKQEIKIPIKVSSNLLYEALLSIQKELYQKPKNASWELLEGVPVLKPHCEGLNLDVRKTFSLALAELAGGNTDIPLSINIIEPEITTSYLPDFQHLVSSCTTSLGADSNEKKHNILTAAKKINGYILNPGSIFSFNSIVGDVTAAEGYKDAPVIQNNKFVPGVGGGICQLATNLYLTALHADLEIVERHNHSRPVSYVPMGLDATVATGVLDLKFKNNFHHPLIITVSVDMDSLHTSIYGPQLEKKETSLLTEIVEYIAPTELIHPDPNLPQDTRVTVQEGEEGYRVRVYKILSGEKGSKTLISEDIYRPVNKVVRMGIKSAGEIK